MTTTTDFELFMKQVDAAIVAKIGVGAYDLPDFMYCDYFADGFTPKQTAKDAIKAAREF